MPLVIALPLFNDWTAACDLLARIDAVLASSGRSAGVLVIDDGSTQPEAGRLCASEFRALAWVRILRLRRNLGHQRAIAIGLAWLEARLNAGLVVLMDADGEDLPEDIPRLVRRCEDEACDAIVFAERRRRAEGTTFRIFYSLYRALHVALTGRGVQVGNFSVIPHKRLRALVTVAELWNHYAAAVFRSKQPCVTVPTVRGVRLDGRSRMNFVALVLHGLSAISVYDDVVFVRVIVASTALAAAAGAMLVAVVGIRLSTDWAVPGWATYTTGLLAVILVQAMLFLASMVILKLGSRPHAEFIPSRDHGLFVDDVVDVWTIRSSPPR